VRRLGRLVEDLRTLSLGDAGQLTLLRESVDVGGLAEHVASRMVPIASERGVDLNIEMRGNLPNVNADEDRLAQVITNLVDNALRHTPRGGAVTVRAKPDNGHVVLEVADTGPGIPPADQPYLFERFWRADQSRNRNSGGSGLGLAIVRQLVELHGGSIGVESKLGAGATFRVSLPAEG
jgi:two-component system sensor histidine kinase BaeS